jgi:hypothetical protein
MPGAERHRLYLATIQAFRRAKETFDHVMMPGTPEWESWQACLQVLFEANAAFLHHERQSRAQPSAEKPDSN